MRSVRAGWRSQDHARSLLLKVRQLLITIPHPSQRKRMRAGESTNSRSHHNDPCDCLLCPSFLDNMLLRTLSRHPGTPTESSPTPPSSSCPSQTSQWQSRWERRCPPFPHLPAPNTRLSHCLSFLPTGLCLAQNLSPRYTPALNLEGPWVAHLASDRGKVPMPLRCLTQTFKVDLSFVRCGFISELYMC